MEQNSFLEKLWDLTLVYPNMEIIKENIKINYFEIMEKDLINHDTDPKIFVTIFYSRWNIPFLFDIGYANDLNIFHLLMLDDIFVPDWFRKKYSPWN